MVEIIEFVDESGRSPFGRWFDSLNPAAAARVTVILSRLEKGNLAALKSVGGGVLEARIDFGPGYRVYLGRHGNLLIVLLGGGTKQRQSQDIMTARVLWSRYRARSE